MFGSLPCKDKLRLHCNTRAAHLIVVFDQVLSLLSVGGDNRAQVCDCHLIMLNQDSLQAQRAGRVEYFISKTPTLNLTQDIAAVLPDSHRNL